jgi:hypothetical protein
MTCTIVDFDVDLASRGGMARRELSTERCGWFEMNRPGRTRLS